MSSRILVQQINGDEVSLLISGLSETYHLLKPVKDLVSGEITPSIYRKIQANGIRIDSGFAVRTGKSNTFLVFLNANRDEDPIGHTICLNLVKKLKTNFLINFEPLFPALVNSKMIDRNEHGHGFYALLKEQTRRARAGYSHANILYIYFVGGKIHPVNLEFSGNHAILDFVPHNFGNENVFEKNQFITLFNRTINSLFIGAKATFKTKTKFETNKIGLHESKGIYYVTPEINAQNFPCLLTSISTVRTQIFLNTYDQTTAERYTEDISAIFKRLPGHDPSMMKASLAMKSNTERQLLAELISANFDYLIKTFMKVPDNNHIYIYDKTLYKKTKHGTFASDLSYFFPGNRFKTFGFKATNFDYLALFKFIDTGDVRIFYEKSIEKIAFVTNSGSIALDRYVPDAIFIPRDLSTGFREIKAKKLDKRDLETIEIKRIDYVDFVFCGGKLIRIESDRDRALNFENCDEQSPEHKYRSYDFPSVTNEMSEISLYFGNNEIIKVTRNDIIMFGKNLHSNNYYEQLTMVV
jgi:hypothetical protein